MLHAEPDDLEVLLEVQLEGPERVAEVVGGLRHPRERQDDVAGRHLLLQPRVILEDVAPAERKPLPPGKTFQVAPLFGVSGGIFSIAWFELPFIW